MAKAMANKMQKQHHKRKHKHKYNYSHDIRLDKPTIIKRLLKLNFSMDRTLRAFKVYEHNYGKQYDFEVLIEIIVRLQRKDAMKRDKHCFETKEEEKRNTTKYFIHDREFKDKYNHTNYTERCSLSLSVSSDAQETPINLEQHHYNSSKIELLRRHTENDKAKNIFRSFGCKKNANKTKKTKKKKKKK